MIWEEKAEILQDHEVRVYHAGYAERFRNELVRQQDMKACWQLKEKDITLFIEIGKNKKEGRRKRTRKPTGLTRVGLVYLGG